MKKPPSDLFAFMANYTPAPPIDREHPAVIGECFDNAFAALARNRAWKLCHGIPLGTGGSAAGLHYGHAWLEFDTGLIVQVYDPTMGGELPGALYYHAGSIEPHEVVRYSWDEARRKALRHGHPGPWAKAIRAVTPDEKD